MEEETLEEIISSGLSEKLSNEVKIMVRETYECYRGNIQVINTIRAVAHKTENNENVIAKTAETLMRYAMFEGWEKIAKTIEDTVCQTNNAEAVTKVAETLGRYAGLEGWENIA
ncbi:MAG: hypothetical protein QXS07_02170, partial [Candidatus Pacearchaeota archaeon]